ncbi:MAG: Phosphoribosyl transferase domain protein [Oscillospiraceae bacterium]|jgi:competence protein ComFC
MTLKEIMLFCLELLFPPHCVFCDKVIAPGTKICKLCANSIVPVNAVRCMNLTGYGQNIPCIVLYPYENQVRDSIIRFKFHGEKRYAYFYAEQLAKLIAKQSSLPVVDVVTAVPISRERKQKRGYNQSELIAKKVAVLLNLPFDDCLEKIRDNPEQHWLPRLERIENVKGVYRADEKKTAGKNILLIDDIVTTGSTLSECASVLLTGGARTVVCAAVAQAN